MASSKARWRPSVVSEGSSPKARISPTFSGPRFLLVPAASYERSRKEQAHTTEEERKA